MCEWNNVKEKLPEEEGMYICFLKHQGIKIRWYSAQVKGSRMRWWSPVDDGESKRVTHWMKLEEPSQ